MIRWTHSMKGLKTKLNLTILEIKEILMVSTTSMKLKTMTRIMNRIKSMKSTSQVTKMTTRTVKHLKTTTTMTLVMTFLNMRITVICLRTNMSRHHTSTIWKLTRRHWRNNLKNSMHIQRPMNKS